jgi:plastocyanin
MHSKSVKTLTLVLMLLALVSISLAACTRPGTTAASTGSNGASPSGAPGSGSSGASTSDVHMGDAVFIQTTVTIKKGDSIDLIDDSSAPHIIQNGTWDSGAAKPNKEPGAPTVQVQFQGSDSHTVGPFTTSGTFQLYCTIHPNMNLTVTVQ